MLTTLINRVNFFSLLWACSIIVGKSSILAPSSFISGRYLPQLSGIPARRVLANFEINSRDPPYCVNNFSD